VERANGDMARDCRRRLTRGNMPRPYGDQQEEPARAYGTEGV
jgi:hypothetical protein